MLLEAQRLAREAGVSRHDCTGGVSHEAAWTLHSYDPEEVCAAQMRAQPASLHLPTKLHAQ